MYRKYNNGFSGNRGKYQSRKNFGGRRVPKFFDPTNVIYSQQTAHSVIEEYKVVNTFSDFKINDKLKNNLLGKHFDSPTPIQDQAIPLILEGNDLIGIANTGTGKTLAFLIPLLNKVVNDRYQKVLIVAPTRELASQIRDEFYTFSKGLNIFSALCIGGENINRQKQELKRNPNFIIGTPGRLLDHLNSKSLRLDDCASVVLDEADHMVDIGFLKDIKLLVSMLSKNRQSLFFSATIDGKVKEVLNSFVNNPKIVSVKTGDTTENVKQDVIKIKQTDQKINVLHQLLIKQEFEKVLIFARTKHSVQKLSDELIKRGFKSDAIHGNKRQNQRLKTLEKFKRNYIDILIATDVASRGLDIPNVSHVINFDQPENYDTYIHRIGRTGRAKKKGVALTFVN